MVGSSANRPRGRFSRSGHTTHGPRPGPPVEPPVGPPAGPPPVPPQNEPPPYGPPPATPPYGHPTYHHVAGASEPPVAGRTASPAVSMSKAAVSGTNRAARVVTRKVIDFSKADGASESGLTPLIWNQVLSYGTDAMVTVALAGTVFFGASAHAQRGNVLLYLLITMAPFAIVAPFIGPALDRLQHGRRWTMAGTAGGRGVLALLMAAHPTQLLVLYPCALGSLVLSKAYGVVRASAAPRLVPPGMTLTAANSRLTTYGLGSTLVFGGVVGVVIKLTGSYTAGLTMTAIAFAVCAFFALRLPPQVDSAVAVRRHPEEPPRPSRQPSVPRLRRLQSWAGRGYEPHLVVALYGESVLRFLSGLLTIYLAFFVESTQHGLDAALQLGAVIVAAGAGNFAGTAIGSKLKLARPDRVIVGCVFTAAVACIVVALTFNITMAVVGMFLSAVTNSLAKIALDALIQRDVPETLRSSAFARSETFLQLSWVLGAAVGIALPSTRNVDGTIGFWIAAVVVGAVGVVVALRDRAIRTGVPRGRPASTAAPAAPRPMDHAEPQYPPTSDPRAWWDDRGSGGPRPDQ